MRVRITSKVALDFAIAIGIGIIACVAELEILAGSGGLFAGLFLAGARGAMLFIVFALPLGALAVTVLVGLAKGRIGLVIGAISFLAGLLLLSAGLSYRNANAAREDAEQARALDQRAFSSLEAKHTVIAVDGEGECDSICIQIVAQADYAFAAKGKYSNAWTLYRRVEGRECLLAENAWSHFSFLKAGYVGLCAGKSEWSPSDDAILVVAVENDHQRAEAIVGPYFKGQIFEAYERQGGRDRLLGRWVSGLVRYGAKRPRIGAPFEAEDFFSALLNVSVVKADSPGPAGTDELLSELEPLLDGTQLGRSAAYTYRHFAIQAGEAERSRVQRHLQSLFESSRREQILCGLSVVADTQGWPEKDLEFAREAIVTAMASDDAELATAALYALRAFKPEDWTFAHRAIWELPFSPVLRDGSVNLFDALMRRLAAMRGPFPSDLRAKAKARLLSDSELSHNQRTALTAIANHGD